jgi:hypothetical protein
MKMQRVCLHSADGQEWAVWCDKTGDFPGSYGVGILGQL